MPPRDVQSFQHVVVTPAHNEQAHIPELVRSMVSQTRRPDQWIVVDDGSTDQTAALLVQAAKEHPWIVPVRYPHSGQRQVGSKVARIVLWGLAQSRLPWDYFSKIDADLTLPPDYFEQVLEHFRSDPQLGIAGGNCYIRTNDSLHCEHVAADHTRGALKTYRDACYRDIGGIRPVNGWDGIDNLIAQMHGWKTCNFPDLKVLHHRPTGSFHGTLRGRFTAGSFAHFIGYHPLFMLARSVRRMGDRPFVVGGLTMLAGYCYQQARGAERFDNKQAIAFLRRKQLRALAGALRARLLGKQQR